MEKNNIIFINPPLSHEERYGIKSKAGGQTPPNGLCMLAAVVRKEGYPVKILDGAALNLSFKEVAKRIIMESPKYVGITAVTISIFNAVEVAKEIRRRNKNIKIILGGPHLTAVPLETFKRFGDYFDVGVVGEGELTIIDLLEKIDRHKDLKEVNGIVYRKNKFVLITPPREMIKDLSTLPVPAWDLLPNLAEYYSPPAHTVKKFPAALLVTSRGCPGQCTFCDNRVFGRKYRWHSPEGIINLIKILKKEYGIKEIQFKDDNLLVNKKILRRLCELMIEEKLDIVWNCGGRVDMIDKDILKIMKKAGCWQIWYGLESGSDRVLKETKKNINVEQIKKAVFLTKNAGISPGGYFMLGMPTETEADIKKTIDLLLYLPLDEFHISHLTPFPGSEIYYTAKNYGTFDNDWKKMNGWNTIFIPKGLTEEKLIHYSNLAFRKFYFRYRIILNYLKKIKSPKLLLFYLEAFVAFLEFTGKKKR